MSNDKFIGADVKMELDEDGILHYTKEQDIEPILKRNEEKRRWNTGLSGEFYEVGEVPETVFLEWLKELGVTYQQWANDPELKAKTFRKLMDRENDKFRTKDGKF